MIPIPTGQVYATNVPQTTLTSQVNATTTTFPVNSSSGWPSPPFTAIIDIAQSTQEPVDVTAVAGTNWTVTRAIDSTTGFAHAINATVTHGDIGRDFREPRAHIDASATPDATGHAVHGLQNTSAVVGTLDTQTLGNKTLSSPLVTGAVGMGTGNWTGTGILQESALAFSGLTGATAQTTRIVGTVTTGAAPASGTFALGDMVYDTFYKTLWACTSAGTPGTWQPIGGRATVGNAAAGTVTVPAWANTARIAWNVRSDGAGTGGSFVGLRMNGDTGGNYTWEAIEANTTTALAENGGATATSARIGVCPKAGDTAGYMGAGELTISNLQSAQFKVASCYSQSSESGTTGWSMAAGGTWLNTAAVTSLTILTLTGAFTAASNMSVEFSI